MTHIEDEVTYTWTPREAGLAAECRMLREQLALAMAFVPKYDDEADEP